MGVPKFYRWISERYPCLSEVISDTEIPEFDNLYLDMNGIIHNCSHPNDDDVNFRISQEQIFSDIFAYIDHGQIIEESSLSSAESSDECEETTEDSLEDEAAFVSSDEEADIGEIANRIPDGGLPSASYLLTHLNSDDDQDESELCEALMAAELREMDDNSLKMTYENITKTELRQQAEGYVRAIQWNLHYYYRGCVSWNWPVQLPVDAFYLNPDKVNVKVFQQESKRPSMVLFPEEG
ncbi:hypothetical protein OSTOST_03672 [Ostertagia ostertagi]